jgi:translocation and assembly module TamB
LKELTTDQPLQYSLRYRLNDQLLLRGSTDLSGDSRAVLEYDKRF